MSEYCDDMSQEKAPSRKKLLPEGWRLFKVVDIKEGTSKQGNIQFIASLEDSVTQYIDTVYLVRVPGKRWLLKSMLEALGIKRSEEGKYSYKLSDLLNKDIEGEVIHEDNEWINRDGQTIKSKQHKIVSFRSVSKNPDGSRTAADIAWEE